MLLSPNAEVVVLYRTDVFSEWTNINHTPEDESAYFIKVRNYYAVLSCTYRVRSTYVYLAKEPI